MSLGGWLRRGIRRGGVCVLTDIELYVVQREFEDAIGTDPGADADEVDGGLDVRERHVPPARRARGHHASTTVRRRTERTGMGEARTLRCTVDCRHVPMAALTLGPPCCRQSSYTRLRQHQDHGSKCKEDRVRSLDSRPLQDCLEVLPL